MRGPLGVRKVFIARKVGYGKECWANLDFGGGCGVGYRNHMERQFPESNRYKTWPNSIFDSTYTVGSFVYFCFVYRERALEVLIKAWRQGGKACLAQEAGLEEIRVQKKLEEYKGEHRDGHFSLGWILEFWCLYQALDFLAPYFRLAVRKEWYSKRLCFISLTLLSPLD